MWEENRPFDQGRFLSIRTELIKPKQMAGLLPVPQAPALANSQEELTSDIFSLRKWVGLLLSISSDMKEYFFFFKLMVIK